MLNLNRKTASDLAKCAYTEYGVGKVKGNPKRCLHCRKPIRKGEVWTKHVSAEDPKFGRYSFIIHSQCHGAKK